MARKVIKVDSNPSKKTNIKTSSPTTDAVRKWSEDNMAREKYYGLTKGSTKSIIEIDSNPVKPGSTTVSPLAKKRGPSKLASFGGGMGGMFSPKNK